MVDKFCDQFKENTRAALKALSLQDRLLWQLVDHDLILQERPDIMKRMYATFIEHDAMLTTFNWEQLGLSTAEEKADYLVKWESGLLTE